jgi:hypothetical protein
MKISLPKLASVAAFGAVLTIAGTLLANPAPQGDEPPPPPEEVPPPPPPPPPPPDQQGEPTGAPPAEYKSSATQAWGETPDQGAQPQPAATGQPAQPDPEKAALKKKCDELKSKGQPLPEECKALELDIVFQGGLPVQKGPVKGMPQAKDTESAPVLEEGLEVDTAALVTEDGKVDVWEIARREPTLFASQRRNYLSAGVYVGYPLMFGRGETIGKAYQPVIHVGAEVAYQALRLFQVALVFDFDYMRGLSAYDEELRPSSTYPDTTYLGGAERPAREVGAILDDYYGFGLRPSFRLTLQFLDDHLLTFLGAGLGWHHFKASGRWRTKLPVEDPANETAVDTDSAQWSGTDYAIYEFEEYDNGLYSVFELALMYRWLDARLGTGVVMQYTVPIHGGIEPDVTVQQDYGVTDDLGNPLEGYQANENDYGDSFIRHLSSLSFLTFNLFVDFRF